MVRGPSVGPPWATLWGRLRNFRTKLDIGTATYTVKHHRNIKADDEFRSKMHESKKRIGLLFTTVTLLLKVYSQTHSNLLEKQRRNLSSGDIRNTSQFWSLALMRATAIKHCFGFPSRCVLIK